MTFAPGIATIEVETSTTGLPYGHNSEMFLQAIPEQRWHDETKLLCQAHIRMPLAVHQVLLDGRSTSSTFTIQIEDYTTYYFVLKDCQSRFIGEYNNSNLSLNIKLHLLNNDREVGEE